MTYRLCASCIAASLAVVATATQAPSEADAIREIRVKLSQDAAAGKFSGVVLIANGSKPVFEQAYGLANVAKGLPNTTSTRFNLGSNTKLFTAVAILQLAEAGKLSLTAPIGRYLPDYPDKAVATKVTVAELLAHRGATGDYFGPEYQAHRLELRTGADYIKRFSKLGLQGEPGGRPVYSNYGYILLGAIIERLSGEDYWQYCQDHICKPAGLADTGFPALSELTDADAVGYTAGDNGKLVPNSDTLPYRGTSAGGGYSTAGDELRFVDALVQHRLLNARSVRLLTTGEPDRPGGPTFPLGMGGSVVHGVRYSGHVGGAPGVSAALNFSEKSGYVIVVLANRDLMLAADVSRTIEDLLPTHGS